MPCAELLVCLLFMGYEKVVSEIKGLSSFFCFHVTKNNTAPSEAVAED